MVAIAIITRFGLGRIANGRVAQLAEHTPEKRGVTGSTPVSTTICVAYDTNIAYAHCFTSRRREVVPKFPAPLLLRVFRLVQTHNRMQVLCH
jgi:hypothetical protein